MNNDTGINPTINTANNANVNKTRNAQRDPLASISQKDGFGKPRTFSSASRQTQRATQQRTAFSGSNFNYYTKKNWKQSQATTQRPHKTMAGRQVDLYIESAWPHYLRSANRMLILAHPRKRRDINPKAPYAGAYVRNFKISYNNQGRQVSTMAHGQFMTRQSFNKILTASGQPPLSAQDLLNAQQQNRAVMGVARTNDRSKWPLRPIQGFRADVYPDTRHYGSYLMNQSTINPPSRAFNLNLETKLNTQARNENRARRQKRQAARNAKRNAQFQNNGMANNQPQGNNQFRPTGMNTQPQGNNQFMPNTGAQPQGNTQFQNNGMANNQPQGNTQFQNNGMNTNRSMNNQPRGNQFQGNNRPMGNSRPQGNTQFQNGSRPRTRNRNFKTMAGRHVDLYMESAWPRFVPKANKMLVLVRPRKRRDVNPKAPYAGAYVRNIKTSYTNSRGRRVNTIAHGQFITTQSFNKILTANGQPPLSSQDFLNANKQNRAVMGVARSKDQSKWPLRPSLGFRANVYPDDRHRGSYMMNQSSIEAPSQQFDYDLESQYNHEARAEKRNRPSMNRGRNRTNNSPAQPTGNNQPNNNQPQNNGNQPQTGFFDNGGSNPADDDLDM